jgi:hypothetical protein
MSFAHDRPRRTRIATAAVLACVAIAGAGCGSASRSSATQTAPPRNPAAAWHQVVLCARAHGMPGLRDPRIDASGKPIFPNGLNVPEQTRRACQSMFDRLVPNAENQAPTAAQLRALMQFARCMRSRGIPDWPDPRPDGSFVPDARISNSLKSVFRSQLTTCEHFNPDPRGRVYFSHP